jgi:hypothetical protein
MPVSWEALTAIASLVSSLAVLAAVLVAIRQVRVGTAQVDHLRRATQLQGTMVIFDKLANPEQQHARMFIATELGERLKDSKYLEELRAEYAPAGHPELEVLRIMEMIGTYVKHRLLDADIIFDYWHPAIVTGWERLDELGVIAAYRTTAGPDMWENFEALYHQAKAWRARRGRNEVVAGAPPT